MGLHVYFLKTCPSCINSIHKCCRLSLLEFFFSPSHPPPSLPPPPHTQHTYTYVSAHLMKVLCLRRHGPMLVKSVITYICMIDVMGYLTRGMHRALMCSDGIVWGAYLHAWLYLSPGAHLYCSSNKRGHLRYRKCSL